MQLTMRNQHHIPAESHWAVTPDGRIGLTAGEDFEIDEHGGADRILTVQLGSSGPFEEYSETELEPATEDDVAAAGLSGVNGKFVDLSKPDFVPGKF